MSKMIKIKEAEEFVELICMGRKVIIPTKLYNLFKENLIVEYSEIMVVNNREQEISKSKKINVDDITFGQFNCLLNKHQANYSDVKTKRLNIRHLLSVCDWYCV